MPASEHDSRNLGLFFVGTDTGVGKTVVTTAVTRHLKRQGHGIRVCKPVATGAVWIDGHWISEDTQRLAGAAETTAFEQITPWSFPDPVAPPVAARMRGVSLDLESIAAAVERQGRPDSILLVEGVGGLLCPLTDRQTVADLAALLGLPLVVVARRSLGTLNHTLLTLEVAQARGLAVAGVVVNETTPPLSLAEATNIEELRSRIRVPLLAVIPFQTETSWAELPAVAAVDWRQLASRGQRATRSGRGVGEA